MLAVQNEEDQEASLSLTRCQNIDKKKLCASLVTWALLAVVLLQIVFHFFWVSDWSWCGSTQPKKNQKKRQNTYVIHYNTARNAHKHGRRVEAGIWARIWKAGHGRDIHDSTRMGIALYKNTPILEEQNAGNRLEEPPQSQDDMRTRDCNECRTECVEVDQRERVDWRGDSVCQLRTLKKTG